MLAAAGLHPGCEGIAADTFDHLAHFKHAASATQAAQSPWCHSAYAKPATEARLMSS
jgi:hypothetical protein